MVKIFVGLKGSGKTKTLIEMANSTVETSNGTVVCIEKGTKLIHEIKYQARLINTDEYHITDAEALFGFVAGIIASDHDAKDLFIDSSLKICNNDVAAFETFVKDVAQLTEAQEVRLVMTASIAAEDVPESVRCYIA
ncbi:MAG: hypothetical protein IJZ37_01950 [Clostridia bacterium]|nr:hypothetical protein [Clostridia bacterium]MBQ8399996.1 hypothetical protein [Clostridia bacterium]